jgi:hypothetical protein
LEPLSKIQMQNFSCFYNIIKIGYKKQIYFAATKHSKIRVYKYCCFRENCFYSHVKIKLGISMECSKLSPKAAYNELLAAMIGGLFYGD